MNFFRKIKVLCILPLVALFLSCATTQNCGCDNRSLSIVPPTNSFVKILVFDKKGNPASSGSGVIIDHVNGNNTIIATAKHICQDKSGFEYRNIRILDVFEQKYKGLVLITTPDHDICLITTKVKVDFPAVKIADNPPKQGDFVYNIAAPYGIHGDGMALIFHGYYSGKISIPQEEYALDVFTVPGAGGSSGSPVFNENWELVGIVSRGFALLEHVMLSVGSEHVIGSLETIRPEIAKLAHIRVLIDTMDALIDKKEKPKDTAKAVPPVNE